MESNAEISKLQSRVSSLEKRVQKLEDISYMAVQPHNNYPHPSFTSWNLPPSYTAPYPATQPHLQHHDDQKNQFQTVDVAKVESTDEFNDVIDKPAQKCLKIKPCSSTCYLQ